MNGKELEILQREFTDLRARFEEKWDSHDKRSEEIWKEIKEDIVWMQGKISILPCEKIKERMKWHGRLIWTLWMVVVVAGIVRGGSWVMGLIK